MARIVIVTRDAELFEFVGHALAQEGHRIRYIDDAGISVSRVNTTLPDLLIVDTVSLDSNARELCLRVRHRRSAHRARILILRSASDANNDHGIELRGDAYLVRPLHPSSLIICVRALLGTKAVEGPSGQLTVEDLVIDPLALQVTRSGRSIPLTVCEFRLLHYLASHSNQVCRRDHLFDVVWENPNVAARTVDVFVRRLREKIEDDPNNPRFILTVRTQGYLFQIPPIRSLARALQDGPSAETVEHT